MKDKRVCDQVQKMSDATTPYATIPAGQRFVTPYGIVQVIADDRAIPQASNALNDVTDKSSKQRMKLYYSALSKREARHQKQMFNVAVISRARRILLQRAYDDQRNIQETMPTGGSGNQINSVETRSRYAQSVWNAYRTCSGVPTTSVPKLSPLEHPTAPVDSYPDRIVEGMIIPDERPRYIGHPMQPDGTISHTDFTVLDGRAADVTSMRKIYMQRRLLTTVYSPDNSRYYCPMCYQCFASKPGYKYHVDSDACRNKAKSKAAASEEQRITIEERAQQFVDRFHHRRNLLLYQHDDDMTQGVISPPQKNDVIGKLDVQPSMNTIESSGDGFCSSDGPFPDPSPVILQQHNEGDNDVSTLGDTNDSLTVVSPDVVLAQLEADFYRSQGRMIGPMYPGVWKALGYRKPTSKKKKKVKNRGDCNVPPSSLKENKIVSIVPVASVTLPPVSGSDRASLPNANFDRPDLSIIDIHPLVQEVDAGRYPSMKRYNGEDSGRDSKCAICKLSEVTMPGNIVNDVKLIPCGFCRQVEHFACAQTKFVIKNPEPADDFMCHNCIAIIAARRSRAEKRRLEKMHSSSVESPTLMASALQEQKFSSGDQAKHIELIALTNGIIHNREFDCVAAQACRLDELTVLLRDAQTRLSLCLDVMTMNQTRRSLVETVYKNDIGD
jgi:hypothetical protein